MKITLMVELDEHDGVRTTERGGQHLGSTVARTIDVAVANPLEWGRAIERAAADLGGVVADALHALNAEIEP